MTRRSGERRPRAGISVLELLLSLAVMSMLAIAMFSALDMVSRALERGRSGSAQLQMLTARLTLRRWIEDMPLGTTLSGDPAGLTFATIIDDGLFWPGAPAIVTLSCRGERLIASAAQTPESGGPREQSVTLSPDCGGVALQYFGALPSAHSPAWHSAWPAAAGRPLLVRLDYSAAGRPLPQLTAIPARSSSYSEMSLSSPVPPG